MLNCVSLAIQFKTCHFCSSQKSLACEINDVCNVVAYITDHEELSCTKNSLILSLDHRPVQGVSV